MQTLAETLPTALRNPRGNPRESDLPKSIAKTLSAKNKQQLTEILEQVCALQKSYGKTAAELEILVEGFSWALADYPMYKILKAMREYVLNNSDIPAPADVIKLLKKADEPPIVEVSIETLLRYRSKGIPLSPRDKQRLFEAGHHV